MISQVHHPFKMLNSLMKMIFTSCFIILILIYHLMHYSLMGTFINYQLHLVFTLILCNLSLKLALSPTACSQLRHTRCALHSCSHQTQVLHVWMVVQVPLAYVFCSYRYKQFQRHLCLFTQVSHTFLRNEL